MLTAQSSPGVPGGNKGTSRENESADTAALTMNAPA